MAEARAAPPKFLFSACYSQNGISQDPPAGWLILETMTGRVRMGRMTHAKIRKNMKRVNNRKSITVTIHPRRPGIAAIAAAAPNTSSENRKIPLLMKNMPRRDAKGNSAPSCA